MSVRLHISNSTAPQIVIDGAYFQYGGASGIARVWASLLQEWSRTEFGKSLFVINRGGRTPAFRGIRAYATFPEYGTANAALDSSWLEIACRRFEADLFVSTHVSTPLETPTVCMVHDMIPEMFGDYSVWIREKRYCANHAMAYIAVSENTVRDLHDIYPLSRNRPFLLARNGVSEKFRPVGDAAIEAFRRQQRIRNPYYLCVGGRAKHKNAKQFFRAFSLLPDKERFSIVCCGGHSQLEPELQAFAEGCDVHMLSPSDVQLNVAFAGAISLVYPSLYEGFGLPIAEAMASGCPVITCRNSATPEVAGDAAIYVEDGSVSAMVDALIEVRNSETRNALIQAGLKQSSQFSWQESARSIAEFLTEMALRNRKEKSLVSSQHWREFRSYQKKEDADPKRLKRLESIWMEALAADQSKAGESPVPPGSSLPRLAKQASGDQRLVGTDVTAHPVTRGATGKRFAYVFYATEVTYAVAVLVFVGLLKELGIRRDADVLVLHTPLPENLLAKFKQMGITTRRVPELKCAGGMPCYRDSLIKLRLFEQSEYDRVVYADADAVPLKPLDDLFDLDITNPVAAPCGYWLPPPLWTSALLVATPSVENWNRLKRHIDDPEDYCIYDMDLINHEFQHEIYTLPERYFALNSDWEDKDARSRTSNPVAAFANTAVVHFTAAGKPWMYTLDEVRQQKPNAYPMFYDIWQMWRDVRDEIMSGSARGVSVLGVETAGSVARLSKEDEARSVILPSTAV